MLHWLLTPFLDDVPTFRLINYISFRAAAAAVTALLLAFLVGPAIIRRLRAMRVQQGVRQGTPDTHQTKASTPTMGGLILLAAAIVSTLLWTRLDNRYVQIALAVTAWMGAIGFLDDYLKLKQKREGKQNVGLVERYKLAGQIAIGVMVGVALWLSPLSSLPAASTTLPFFKYVLIVPAAAGLAWLYVPWVTFILTGVSNSVNLTDGLDGLAAGLAAIALSTFALFAYMMGRVDASAYLQLFYLRDAGELTVYCMALVGA
ncbi:MAG TPA: phospho-N-acetylmuramoyl-pentapeptide-transferase, partial [Gemmatimonadaceae bacterium]|nr:phospho-N-acetylmuramoyl-pentapeptide-transferase [Gemmatimonadaceae bacterium]